MIDRSLYGSKEDFGIFSKQTLPMYGADDDNFGFWANLVTGLVQAGGTIYQTKSSKDIAKSQMAHESRLASISEDTRRMELALQQKQADLLSRSSQRPSPVSAVIKSPIGITAIVGGTIGIGLLAYLLLKKRKRR